MESARDYLKSARDYLVSARDSRGCLYFSSTLQTASRVRSFEIGGLVLVVYM